MLPCARSAKLVLLSLIFLVASPAVHAQAAIAASPAAAVPATPGFAVASLRPALANVQTAVADLGVAHWKVSGATRAATEQDVASMQRDLTTTLPALMALADAAPANGTVALSPSFAVFRNLDALYDVLLRVTETAALAGSSSDANILEEARAGLEDARGKLGAWLLQSISAQDAQIANSQVHVSHQAPPAATGPTKIVVDDGPDSSKPRKKKPPTNPAPQ
jgi:hypothetical protein